MNWLWLSLCIITAALGGSASVLGLWIVASKQDATGLYCLIVTPLLLVTAGIFATLAVKRPKGEPF
jgi:uncharacterized membrane protein